MKYKFITTAVLMTLVSCGEVITENENKAINDILEFFGGYLKYSIGFSSSTEEGKKKYFELELSQSNALTTYKDHKEIVTSGLCYIFFNNLNEKERTNYTHIRGTLLLDNGEIFTKDYAIDELALVKTKLPMVDKVVALMKNKEFSQLKNMLNDHAAFRYDKDELVANMEKVDPELGNITGYRFFGFDFSNAGNDQVLKIFGMVLRDSDNNHRLSIYLDPKTNKEEILKLDYDL